MFINNIISYVDPALLFFSLVYSGLKWLTSHFRTIQTNSIDRSIFPWFSFKWFRECLKLFRTSWTYADKKLTSQKQQCIKFRQLWQSLLYDIKRANQTYAGKSGRTNKTYLISFYYWLFCSFSNSSTNPNDVSMRLVNREFSFLSFGFGLFFLVCANCVRRGMENIKDVKIKRSLQPNDCYFLNSLCCDGIMQTSVTRCEQNQERCSWCAVNLNFFFRFISILWPRLNATSTLIPWTTEQHTSS